MLTVTVSERSSAIDMEGSAYSLVKAPKVFISYERPLAITQRRTQSICCLSSPALSRVLARRVSW